MAVDDAKGKGPCAFMDLLGDDLLRIATFLDAVSIARLAACNKELRRTLDGPTVARWVAKTRQFWQEDEGEEEDDDVIDAMDVDGRRRLEPEIEQVIEVDEDGTLTTETMKCKDAGVSVNVEEVVRDTNAKKCWSLERLHVCESPPRFADLRFPFGNARLVAQGIVPGAGSVQPLDEVFTYMRLHPNVKLKVKGHTQPDCPRSIALGISAERARVASSYISRKLVCAELNLNRSDRFLIQTFERNSLLLYPDGTMRRSPQELMRQRMEVLNAVREEEDERLLQRFVRSTNSSYTDGIVVRIEGETEDAGNVGMSLGRAGVTAIVTRNPRNHNALNVVLDGDTTDEDDDDEYMPFADNTTDDGSSDGDNDDDDEDDDVDDEDIQLLNVVAEDMMPENAAPNAAGNGNTEDGNVSTTLRTKTNVDIEPKVVFDTIVAVEARFQLEAYGNAHPEMDLNEDGEFISGRNRRTAFEIYF